MLLLKCLFSPRLYKIYRNGPQEAMYEPLSWEKWGDKVISTSSLLMNIAIYASPFIVFYMYKRGFFTFGECIYLFGGVGSILIIALFMRAYGRSINPQYIQFLQIFNGANSINSDAYLDKVRKFDFEFSEWPASYTAPAKCSSWTNILLPFQKSANLDLPFYQRITIQILAFFAVHTFGLRLVYPGCMSLINSLLWMPQFQGRTQLVETCRGKRAKLITADKNSIDTMFVDNRRVNTHGDTLVICCEGNSGFYEVGIMTTPIKAGFSVLGWNRPGFGESTGLPYTNQEHNAIDAVMQYAIQELDFVPENIVMFGWSIGGYSAAWAAKKYPVKCVVLDATFDDLLPLAQNHMPGSWSLLVKEVIRSYINLNVVELLKEYDGPVHLVRRTDDEIISLTNGQIATNRGNYLVMELLLNRNPTLALRKFKDLTMYVNMLTSEWPKPEDIVDKEEKDLLLLISKYMRDYRSTHNTPLPVNIFISIMVDINERLG